VKYIAFGTPGPGKDELTIRWFAFFPLFQLDNHRLSGPIATSSRDHAVQPAGSCRKLVFEKHAVVFQLRSIKNLRHRSQRVPP
jgi:hypothetical protein